MLRSDSLATGVLLTMLAAFAGLSMHLYLPSLPSILRSLDSSVFQAQMTMTGYMVGFATAHLLYGPLSDRAGRRFALMFGLSFYIVGSAIAALAPNIETLIVARFFQGIGGCAGPVISRAIVRDVYGRDGVTRVLAYMTAILALVPGFAPIIGGFVDTTLSWRANFGFLALFGLASFAATYFMLRETNQWQSNAAHKISGVFMNYLALYRERTYIGYVAAGSATMAGIMVFLSEAVFLMTDHLGFNAEQLGYGIGITAVGHMAGAFMTARLSKYRSNEQLMLAALCITTCSGLLAFGLVWAGYLTPITLIGPYMIYVFGTAMLIPTSTAAAIGPYPKMAGAAAALLGFTAVTVNATTITIVSVIRDGGPMPMTATTAIMSTTGLLIFYFMIWRRR